MTATDVAAGVFENVVLFRLDPAAFTLRVRYTPGFPAVVSAWDHTARLVFNGGFFDERNAALGLLVTDGQRFGRSYAGFGGMLAVTGDGQAQVRSLKAQPFDPDEALAQAVQCFPMLLLPDGTVYAQADAAQARRTVIGQDAQGRLVLVVAPNGSFTLAGLAAWLAAGDLALTAALNLDGGGSTGYWAGPGDMIDSISPVPAVVAVYAD